MGPNSSVFRGRMTERMKVSETFASPYAALGSGDIVENIPKHVEPRWAAMLALLAVGGLRLALPESLSVGFSHRSQPRFFEGATEVWLIRNGETAWSRSGKHMSLDLHRRREP